MTVPQMVESVLQIFPQAKESQVIIEIDNAQKKFCRESRCLRKLSSLASITSKAQWVVPADFIHLYRVMLYDSTGQKIDKTDVGLDWTLQGGVISPELIFYSTNGSVLSSIPTTVSAILVRYSYLPTAITTRAGTFTLTNDYIDGVYAYVMESMYSKFPVVMGIGRNGEPIVGMHLGMLQYWQGKAKQTERLAKKILNMGDDTEREPQYYGDAGRLVLPEEQKLTTTGGGALPTWT